MYGRIAESTSGLRSQWMKVRLDDWMNGLIMDEITCINWPAINQSELKQCLGINGRRSKWIKVVDG